MGWLVVFALIGASIALYAVLHRMRPTPDPVDELIDAVAADNQIRTMRRRIDEERAELDRINEIPDERARAIALAAFARRRFLP
jgi:hypothetical protein